jgi:hypothetical protein
MLVKHPVLLRDIKEAAEKNYFFPVPLSISLGQAAQTDAAQTLNYVLGLAETLMYEDKIKEGRKVRSKLLNHWKNFCMKRC